MTISFSDYVGTAGDLQAMLIAETDDGRYETVLYNRASFKKLNRYIAMCKLIYRLS